MKLNKTIKLLIFTISLFMLIGINNVSAMQIFIEKEDGNKITLDVEPTDRIIDVKNKIQDKEEIFPSKQKLIFATHELDNEYTLQDYSIRKESVLQLIIDETYKVGDTIYFNPITAHICTKEEENCLEWYVFESNSIIKLQAKKSIGKTTVANLEKKIISGCFENDTYNAHMNKQQCEEENELYIMMDMPGRYEWRENVLIDSYKNRNNLLSFLKTTTDNWSNKLLLTKTYDDLDLTGFKARVFSYEEAQTVVDADSTGRGTSIYNFLKDEQVINNQKSYLTTYILPKDSMMEALLKHGAYMDTNIAAFETNASIKTNELIDIYPMIELNKSYLETYSVTKEDTTNGSFTINSENQYFKDKVAILTNPKTGYEVDTIIVKDSLGNNIEVNDSSFIMPQSNVFINVTFKATTLNIKNPKTYDGITLYIIFGLLSIIGLLITLKNCIIKNN